MKGDSLARVYSARLIYGQPDEPVTFAASQFKLFVPVGNRHNLHDVDGLFDHVILDGQATACRRKCRRCTIGNLRR